LGQRNFILLLISSSTGKSIFFVAALHAV